jgi:hypothetical protein
MSGTEPIEITVARLDERFKGFQEAFGQMVDDQRRLTDSYEKLVESNQRIGLVETDVVNLKDSQKKLWEKFDAHERAHAKITSHALYDILKLGIAVIAGAVLAKYGIHLP